MTRNWMIRDKMTVGYELLTVVLNVQVHRNCCSEVANVRWLKTVRRFELRSANYSYIAVSHRFAASAVCHKVKMGQMIVPSATVVESSSSL